MFYDRIGTQLRSSLSRNRLDVRTAENRKGLRHQQWRLRFHEFYCTVFGIVVTVVSSIDSLRGAVHKLSNNTSSIPLWKRYDIAVSLNSENDTDMAILVKDFDTPATTLITVSQNKDILPSHFFFSEHTPNHHIVSGNPNQRILQTLPGFSIEIKGYFRNDLL